MYVVTVSTSGILVCLYYVVIDKHRFTSTKGVQTEDVKEDSLVLEAKLVVQRRIRSIFCCSCVNFGSTVDGSGKHMYNVCTRV